MRYTTLAAIVLALSVAPLDAQTAEALNEKVKTGDTLFVTDRTGVQAKGRLIRLSPEDLTLLIGGEERALPFSGIGRIEKRDPLWNGIWAIPRLPQCPPGAFARYVSRRALVACQAGRPHRSGDDERSYDEGDVRRQFADGDHDAGPRGPAANSVAGGPCRQETG
jgi:hypothetical protein